MKIDIFNHIITPEYHKRRMAVAPPGMRLQEAERILPTLFDLDRRLRVMDTAGEGYVQIISTANPPVESMAGPGRAGIVTDRNDGWRSCLAFSGASLRAACLR